ncbi:MAG: hypothetical protein JSV08_00730 [Acidobacteriota bacterium]|nr:MAG: hypothetical protein JSV08_00730 [Acidobacteriota bacterium]
MFFLFLFFLSTTLLGLVAIGLACRPFSNRYPRPASMYYGAVAVGCSLTIFFINLISYAIPFAWSVVLGHTLGVLVLLFSWWSSKDFREEMRLSYAHFRKFWPTIPKLLLSPVWWTVVLTVALMACTRFFLRIVDFPAHHAFIGTIAHGNFPVMCPFAPDEPLAYPYGFHLLAALLYRATGWDIGFVAGIVVAWVFIGAALAVAGFVKAYFLAKPAATVVSILFYFFGSSITGVAVILTHARPGKLMAASALPYIQFAGIARSVAYAVLPMLLLLVEAFWKRRLGSSLLPWFVLVACLMASIGLTSPELLAVMGLAIVVVALKDIWRGKEGTALKAALVGVLALSLLLSCLQGGAIDFSQSADKNVGLEREQVAQPLPSKVRASDFYLRWPTMILTYPEGYVGVSSPLFWRVVLLEFGPLFLLFPYYLKPRGDPFKQILLLSVCISLAVPLFVGYSVLEWNMSRFFQVSVLIVPLFSGSFLVRIMRMWVTNPSVRRISLAILVSMMILTPIGYWTGILWLRGSKAPYAVDSKIEVIVSDFKRLVPPPTRILTVSDFIYPLHRDGYFALHDRPPLTVAYLLRDGKEDFDASLKFRERETFLAWRPDYLLVPEDVLRRFQAMLPEVSTSVLRRYTYSRGVSQDTHSNGLYFVKVAYTGGG